MATTRRARNLSLPDAIEKAEHFLQAVASRSEYYGDQEALVYFASRGRLLKKDIAATKAGWKAAIKCLLQEYACWAGTIDTNPKTRKFEVIPFSPRKSIPKDIRKISVWEIRNFWGGNDQQECSIDATMLRTVEWCEITGFDPWWQRFAEFTRENILGGGAEKLPRGFFLFNLCRSPFAISLLGDTMNLLLDAVSPTDRAHFPWHEYFPTPNKPIEFRQHFDHAATIAFASHRLLDQKSKRLAQKAAKALLSHQNPDGGWPCWERTASSIESTARIIHALSLVRPKGWKAQSINGAEWLLHQQSKQGYWSEPECPDPTYLTVLVLDALALVHSKGFTTLGLPPASAKISKKALPLGPFFVALSFPGEHRTYVKKVARLLGAKLGVQRVFYDNNFKAILARPNLDTLLQDIYNQHSELVVVFLCREYAKKKWCGLEWRAIRELINTRDDLLMLLQFDDTKISGLFSNDGYVDLQNLPPATTARLILDRLDNLRKRARLL